MRVRGMGLRLGSYGGTSREAGLDGTDGDWRPLSLLLPLSCSARGSENAAQGRGLCCPTSGVAFPPASLETPTG